MVSKELPQLSKSRFMSGLQCLKRLYLECYHRDLADPTDANQQHLFDVGTAVGELAREIYPAGTLIEEKYFEHAPAEESTASALANNPVDALFESAFSFERIRTRVDILKSAGGQRYDLIEVKSGTRVKEEHIPDIAIQLHVTGSDRRALIALRCASSVSAIWRSPAPASSFLATIMAFTARVASATS